MSPTRPSARITCSRPTSTPTSSTKCSFSPTYSLLGLEEIGHGHCIATAIQVVARYATHLDIYKTKVEKTLDHTCRHYRPATTGRALVCHSCPNNLDIHRKRHRSQRRNVSGRLPLLHTSAATERGHTVRCLLQDIPDSVSKRGIDLKKNEVASLCASLPAGRQAAHVSCAGWV